MIFMPLSQSGVLGFGLLVDGDVRVGVFPEGEEILIRGAGFIAGGGILAASRRKREPVRGGPARPRESSPPVRGGR